MGNNNTHDEKHSDKPATHSHAVDVVRNMGKKDHTESDFSTRVDDRHRASETAKHLHVDHPDYKEPEGDDKAK